MENTIVIFFPFNLTKIHSCYLEGDFEFFDTNTQTFFVTKLLKTCHPKRSINLFASTEWDGNETRLKSVKNWMYVSVTQNKLTVKKLKIHGSYQNLDDYHILWINYDFHVFSQFEIPSPNLQESDCKNHIDILRRKIIKINTDRRKVLPTSIDNFKSFCLNAVSFAVLKAANINLRQLRITKYFNVALHMDNYLKGFLWAFTRAREKQKLDIKVTNFLLSVLLDMLLGILFLNWLNSKVSLDSSATIFILTVESVVNSIKELINWLKGDPAGLKLNWAFNKVLGTFFSFHIDIWWTFVAYLQPLVKIVFQIFLKVGLLGITFQASIISDLLSLVSFHVYCIYAYAAKLYSIQISTMISLWRLFLGHKKNPLREKVDSCRYSPEQLFVGTLGFTILLFLLPTTLLYYSVFTSIRLAILMSQGFLTLIRYLNQIIPVYSTVLWLLRSPKIFAGIEIMHYEGSLKSESLLLLSLKPVPYTWWETVNYFMPDCVAKPAGIQVSSLLSSLISGKLIYPI